MSKKGNGVGWGRTTPKGVKPAKHTRHTTKTRALTMVRAKDGIHMVGPKRKDVVLGETHIRMTSQQAALIKALGEKGLMKDTQAAVLDAMAAAQRA